MLRDLQRSKAGGLFRGRSFERVVRKHMSLVLLANMGLASALMWQRATAEASLDVEPTPEERLDVYDLASEQHIRNVRALTHSGENAEAYFSNDGQHLVFQAKARGEKADSIWVMNIDGSQRRRVSSGLGATTCSYFLPGDQAIVYASTHHANPKPPPPPDYSMGYVWPIHSSYDIFRQDLVTGELTQLTHEPGYDAEATLSPDGKKIVFTSTRDGDLELYTMNIDGTNVTRLTHRPGYDGGAFFSPDSSKIVYRTSRFTSREELADYESLLPRGLVRPSALEIYIMNADGSDQRQITNNGAANFAPFFHPSGQKIIYSSNYGSEGGRDFNLFMVDIETGQEEQITFHNTFDAFPMFSPDGKKLVFGSNRFGKLPNETNVFIADWVEHPQDSKKE